LLKKVSPLITLQYQGNTDEAQKKIGMNKEENQYSIKENLE